MPNTKTLPFVDRLLSWSFRHPISAPIPEDGDRERLVGILGRPLHSYSETARALAAA